MYVDKKSSLNIKQGPETRAGGRRGGEGGEENVFAGAFKCMQIAVQPI